MSYQDILDEKDESVKNARKFVNFLKANFSNCEIRSSKQARLITLLNEENDLFDRLNRTNFAEISKELSELKERICFVILDIKDEIAKDFEDKNYEIVCVSSKNEDNILLSIEDKLNLRPICTIYIEPTRSHTIAIYDKTVDILAILKSQFLESETNR